MEIYYLYMHHVMMFLMMDVCMQMHFLVGMSFLDLMIVRIMVVHLVEVMLIHVQMLHALMGKNVLMENVLMMYRCSTGNVTQYIDVSCSK